MAESLAKFSAGGTVMCAAMVAADGIAEEDGERTKEFLGLVGRRLEVGAVAGDVTITESGGGEISGSDVDFVRADYAGVGHPYSLVPGTSAVVLRPGDSVPGNDGFLRRTANSQIALSVFQSPPGSYLMTTHLVATTADLADFAVTIRTPPSDDAVWAHALDLRGHLLVQRNAWPAGLHLAGTARSSVGTMGGVCTLDGTIDLSVDWTYEP
jgi:hypothetical protein